MWEREKKLDSIVEEKVGTREVGRTKEEGNNWWSRSNAERNIHGTRSKQKNEDV